MVDMTLQQNRIFQYIEKLMIALFKVSIKVIRSGSPKSLSFNLQFAVGESSITQEQYNGG